MAALQGIQAKGPLALLREADPSRALRRSGSAPPSALDAALDTPLSASPAAAADFASMLGGLQQAAGAVQQQQQAPAESSEADLLSSDAYRLYYYANKNINPRLPPPTAPGRQQLWDKGLENVLAAGTSEAQAALDLLASFNSQLALKEPSSPITIGQSALHSGGFASSGNWATTGPGSHTNPAEPLESILGVSGFSPQAAGVSPLLSAADLGAAGLVHRPNSPSLFHARNSSDDPSVDVSGQLFGAVNTGSLPNTPRNAAVANGSGSLFDMAVGSPAHNSSGAPTSPLLAGANMDPKVQLSYTGGARVIGDRSHRMNTPSKLRMATNAGDPISGPPSTHGPDMAPGTPAGSHTTPRVASAAQAAAAQQTMAELYNQLAAGAGMQGSMEQQLAAAAAAAAASGASGADALQSLLAAQMQATGGATNTAQQYQMYAMAAAAMYPFYAQGGGMGMGMPGYPGLPGMGGFPGMGGMPGFPMPYPGMGGFPMMPPAPGMPSIQDLAAAAGMRPPMQQSYVPAPPTLPPPPPGASAAELAHYYKTMYELSAAAARSEMTGKEASNVPGHAAHKVTMEGHRSSSPNVAQRDDDGGHGSPMNRRNNFGSGGGARDSGGVGSLDSHHLARNAANRNAANAGPLARRDLGRDLGRELGSGSPRAGTSPHRGGTPANRRGSGRGREGGGPNSGGHDSDGHSHRERTTNRVVDSLLDEFKSNKSSKFEFKDIFGHLFEFSLDQHGSRFIQQKLENAPAEEFNAAFDELLPRSLPLMTDVFGNYVVQKFLEHGSPEQRLKVMAILKGNVMTLTQQMYGCRVIQKALEVLPVDEQRAMVTELDQHVMRCVRDQNGNHVIQKVIECVPTEHIVHIIDHFLACVTPLSTHPFGCRVVQRILEHCRDQRRRGVVMDEILKSTCLLAQDQYGNYVIQHVLEHGSPAERQQVVHQLAPQIVAMSMHKFASNVVEKCLAHCPPAERDVLIRSMLCEGRIEEGQEDPLQQMMKDQFGNYVVQKALEVCDDSQREMLLSRVRAQLHALKKFTYGKHIVTRVEKLLSAGTKMQTVLKNRALPDDSDIRALLAAQQHQLPPEPVTPPRPGPSSTDALTAPAETGAIEEASPRAVSADGGNAGLSAAVAAAVVEAAAAVVAAASASAEEPAPVSSDAPAEPAATASA